MRVCEVRVERALVAAAAFVQRRRDATQDKQHREVTEVERGGLEDALHEGHVDERELHDKRHRDGADQHFVLGNPAAEAAVLKRGDEVEEDEAGEGLQYECECVMSA